MRVFLQVWLMIGLMGSASHTPAQSEVQFSVINTSHSSGAQEAMIVKGGSWWQRRKLVHNAVLIQHPEGDLLLDSGLGRQIESQFSQFGFLDRQLFSYEEVDPARDQLERNGYDFSNLKAIIPTHLHWDHASGLVDFEGTPVWIQKTEYDHALQGQLPSFIQSQFTDPSLVWKFITLENTPFLEFDKSWDVFGDGSVVLVDLSGHTAGQIGAVVTTTSGHRYLFSGDTTWTIEGVRNLKGRPGFIGVLVELEWDNDKNDRRIASLNKAQQRAPDLTIVPAHDERVMDELPVYPTFSSD